MAEINFYHLTKTSLEKGTAQLLSKVHSLGKKAVVLCDTLEQVEKLNSVLWTYSSGAFLPHGSDKDGMAELQPIWLTDHVENPNQATILINSGDQNVTDFSAFDRFIEIFDGKDSDQLATARRKWKDFKDHGHSLKYWAQDENGKWTQKQ